MPEYLTPGVYIEEVPSGFKQISGVSTSTAGFVGAAERGPLNPALITSWLAFQRWYGEYISGSYLAYAVEGFFLNGGQRCYISRVVGENAAFAKAVIDGKLNVVAVGPGQGGDSIGITILKASRAENLRPRNRKEKEISRWVKIIVTYKDMQEVFDDLSIKEGASNNISATINAASTLVRVWLSDNLAADAELVKSRTMLEGGNDGAAPLTIADFQGDHDPIVVPKPGNTEPPAELLGGSTGLAALELFDDISLLIAPDQARDEYYNELAGAVIAQCERLEDRFAIISARAGQSTVQNLHPPHDSSYAGFYYPWIKVLDLAAKTEKLIPAVGHIAGIFARSDMDRGVHKAPANAVLYGARDLEFPVTGAMQDILNPRGVNCIRDFRDSGRGILLWGARTISSDPEWKYINIRRISLYLQESLVEGTQWVVFEPNDESLWVAVRVSIENFLSTLWQSGALMGSTPEEAYFVRCDRSTMTQDDIDNGRFICIIGFAPLKPAEFVIMRISQKTADAPS